MRTRTISKLGLATAMIWGSSVSEAAITGRWINPTRSVTIDIGPCGPALCGTVVAASAGAKRDALKGTKHLIGTRLLTGVRQKSASEWQGQLFVPDENIRAAAKIRPQGKNRLEVSGCKVMICKSQVWTRIGKPGR